MITISGNETEIRVLAALIANGKLGNCFTSTAIKNDNGCKVCSIEILGMPVKFQADNTPGSKIQKTVSIRENGQ